MDYILETKDLKKYYGKEPNITKALDGVSMAVCRGEFVSIIGTSGSGKSTLLIISVCPNSVLVIRNSCITSRDVLESRFPVGSSCSSGSHSYSGVVHGVDNGNTQNLCITGNFIDLLRRMPCCQMHKAVFYYHCIHPMHGFAQRVIAFAAVLPAKKILQGS